MISVIPNDVTDDQLEEGVIEILADIDVTVEIIYIEAYHEFSKSSQKTMSNKILIRLPRRNLCKKALVNRKKLANIDSVFSVGITICKRSGSITSRFTRNRVVHMKTP